MAYHAKRGDSVHVLILGEGITSRAASRARGHDDKALDALQTTAKRANAVLGAVSVGFAGLADNRFDSVDLLDIVKIVEQRIREIRPTLVYTHHIGDLNIDHQLTHQAVVTACRPLPEQTVTRLLFFEVPSSTEYQTPASRAGFQPNWYVPVQKVLALKLKALSVYGSEMRAWPHPRSLQAVKHLAAWRGATVGVPAAEAFMLGRALEEAL